MSFIKFVVQRATVERAMNIPLVADYIASQGIGDLVNDFAQQHPNYSFADLLGEFGIDVATLPLLVKEFVLNHFGAKQAVTTKAIAKPQSNPLTFE